MKISDPIKIGKLLLKNRFMMAAMDLGFVNNGFVTDQLIEFYKERAEGGVGCIVVGGCYTEKIGRMWKGMIGLDNDKFIPGLKKLTDIIHQNGAKTAAQLLHGGGCCHPYFIKEQPVSASAVKCLNKKIGHIPRELNLGEIKATILNFAIAARRAKESGFDAVEIIGSMGYLINQFLSPVTNKRKDRYGGDLHKRMSFLLELIEETRNKVGQDYPLIIKIAGDELIPGGNKLKEYVKIAIALENAGVDAISVSPGRHDSSVSVMSMYIPQGAYLHLTEELKKEVHLPVIAGNRLDSWQLIEQCVENGQTDIVSLGRPLIADSDLPHKILQQKYDHIRWCLSCNQGCFDSIANLKPVTCTINARAGKENKYTIKKVGKPRKIMVIGGGVAGMEAARICALRGHEVSLYEKSNKLGGQACYAASIWGRKEIRNIISFLECELHRLKLDIFLDKEVNRDLITEEAPEVIIIATGTKPTLPKIKGINNPSVMQAADILSGKSVAGENIVVIGGGSVGCEIAIHLSKQGVLPSDNALFLIQNRIIDPQTAIEKAAQGGKKITILEKKKAFGRGIGVSTKWVVLGLLEKLAINLMNEVMVEEIFFKGKDSPHNGIAISHMGKRQFIKADSVVIASGYESDDSLYREVKEFTGIDIFLIGDAAAPRNLLDAIHEGFELGYYV